MRENKLGKRIAFILLAIVCVIWIFPLIWAIFTSFKSGRDSKGWVQFDSARLDAG